MRRAYAILCLMNTIDSSAQGVKHGKHRLPFFYGWVVVIVAFITMGIGVNSRTAFSLLFPPILDEFGWNRGSLAATFSIGFVVSALITPAIGMMMDRTGPRVVLPTGAVLVSTGLMAATFGTEPWHFYLTLGGPGGRWLHIHELYRPYIVFAQLVFSQARIGAGPGLCRRWHRLGGRD